MYAKKPEIVQNQLLLNVFCNKKNYETEILMESQEKFSKESKHVHL